MSTLFWSSRRTRCRIMAALDGSITTHAGGGGAAPSRARLRGGEVAGEVRLRQHWCGERPREGHAPTDLVQARCSPCPVPLAPLRNTAGQERFRRLIQATLETLLWR